MVVECVPSVVAKAMQEEVHVPILGIGAGPYVDCQVLVTQDLLGMYGDFKPKFVKHFASIRAETSGQPLPRGNPQRCFPHARVLLQQGRGDSLFCHGPGNN
ncbi:MAG: 3-methyl-2-oxobutanoate hydroxymethyltransferase [Oscillospiraceae bacterium]